MSDEFKIGENAKEVRGEVWRLLHFAVSDINKDITADHPDLIAKIMPVLEKNENTLTSADIAQLMLAYNILSQLVYPATSESLWIKNKAMEDERSYFQGKAPVSATQKKISCTYHLYIFFLVFFGAITFFVQGYASFISDTLKNVSQIETSLKAVDSQIAAARNANPDKNPRENTNYLIQNLYIQKGGLSQELNDHFCMLRHIELLWYAFDNSGIECKPGSSKTPIAQAGSDAEEKLQNQETAKRNSYFSVFKSVLHIINYLLLPSLLGLLGALAYVIRNILDSFRQSSFTVTAIMRWKMRVALGCALGLISGIIVSPDIEKYDQINFSPLVWGFLMGYSVEFAFSLFDAMIKKGKNIIGEDYSTAQQTVITPANLAKTASLPRINAIAPKQGPEAGGTNVMISGRGFSKDAKVFFGTEPAKDVAVQGESLLSAYSPAGKGVINVVIATGNGKTDGKDNCQYTYLNDDELHIDCCGIQPSDNEITHDHQLPAAEGGVA